MYACTGLKCVQKGRCHEVDDDSFGGVRMTRDLEVPLVCFLHPLQIVFGEHILYS